MAGDWSCVYCLTIMKEETLGLKDLPTWKCYLSCGFEGFSSLLKFAGAAQSLGAGTLLVNPWSISEVATAIEKALTMSDEEREKRHQLNFSHVTTHTAQEWAETFVNELNVTVAEAQLRTKQIRPPLQFDKATKRFLACCNRLIILGFNGTVTEAVDSPGRLGGYQIKEMDLKVHPELREHLTALCNDPKTTVVVLGLIRFPTLAIGVSSNDTYCDPFAKKIDWRCKYADVCAEKCDTYDGVFTCTDQHGYFLCQMEN